MKYDKKLKEKMLKEYTYTSITRKEICAKYSVPFETFKGWIRYDHSKTYGKRIKKFPCTNVFAIFNNSNYKDMSREELQLIIMKKDIEIARLKKKEPLSKRYGRHGIRWAKQRDYAIILELNSQYPIKTLCEMMNVKRDGFYKWINRNAKPRSSQAARRTYRMALFKIYSKKYKTHGYRWLNAKIKLDHADFKCSDLTAHKICKHLGIKSKAKHETWKYTKPRVDLKNYHNLILNKIAPSEPFKVVVSDMTAMKYRGKYYEVTWYMDLFNNEIISFGVSNKHGDPQAYYDGLDGAIFKKQQGYQNFITILHTDCGSIYTNNNYKSKLYLNGFIHSTSTPGNPTENGAMESINGWTKEELLRDFMIAKGKNVKDVLENYIYYFNNERPASALNYLTPMQYKKQFYENTKQLPAKIYPPFVYT